jgi:leucyl-tRNA synthetase
MKRVCKQEALPTGKALIYTLAVNEHATGHLLYSVLEQIPERQRFSTEEPLKLINQGMILGTSAFCQSFMELSML